MVKHLREAVLAVFALIPRGSVVNIAYITNTISREWGVEPEDWETTNDYIHKSILTDCDKPRGILYRAPRGGITMRG